MNSKLGLLVPLIAIAFLGVSACGSSDSDAPTKEEFIAEADGICKQADDELAATIESTFGNQAPTQDEFVTAVNEEVIPSIEGQLNDLRALTPPDGDEDTVNGIYDALERDIEAAKADPVAAIQGEAFAESSRLAGEYGLTDCGGSS